MSKTAFRIVMLLVGMLFAATVIVVIQPAQNAFGSCPRNDTACVAYGQTMVDKFTHHRIGNSHGLQFPRKFKREFHQAIDEWRLHHRNKCCDIPNPFAPIKDFVENQTSKAACAISSTVVHSGGGNCDHIGESHWGTAHEFENNMGYVTDVTLGCGGGALIASFEKPANWRLLTTTLGYRWSPWVLGTGFSACVFTTAWFTSH